MAIGTAFTGVFFLSTGVQGYFFHPACALQRILWIGGAMLLIKPGWMTDLSGIALVFLASIYNRVSGKSESMDP